MLLSSLMRVLFFLYLVRHIKQIEMFLFKRNFVIGWGWLVIMHHDDNFRGVKREIRFIFFSYAYKVYVH